MENERPDLFEQFFDFLSQIVMPDWVGLIALMPLLFLGVFVLFVLLLARSWRRAGRRNRSRVPARLAAGAPPPGVHLPGPSRWPFVVPIGGALVLFALALPARDSAGQVTMPFNVPLLAAGLAVTLVAIAGWLRDAMREWRSTAVGSEAAVGALAPGSTPAAALPAAVEHGAAARPAAKGLILRGEHRPAPAEPPPGVHMPGPSPWPFFAPLGIALLFFGMVLHPALVIGGLALSVVAAAGWLIEASREYRSTEAVGHAVPATRDPDRAWPRWLVPLATSVTALSLAVAIVPGLLGGLIGAPAPSGSAPPQGGVRPEITARTPARFESSMLTVPAGVPFDLVFHNENAGVPHDVAIAPAEGQPPIFNGEDVTGPASITYHVPALDEGDYHFLCTIHPNMNGTLQARP